MEERVKILDDKIKAEKIRHDLGQESAKISALKSGDIDKYEYLTGQEVIPTGQVADLAHAKFEYSPLGKAFEKQVKTIKEQGEKQVKAIENTQQMVPIQNNPKPRLPFPQEQMTENVKAAWKRTLEDEKEIDKNNPVWKSKKIDNFAQYSLPTTLVYKIGSGNESFEKAGKQQTEMVEMYNTLIRGRKNTEKTVFIKNVDKFIKSRRKVLDDFTSVYPTDKVRMNESEDNLTPESDEGEDYHSTEEEIDDSVINEPSFSGIRPRAPPPTPAKQGRGWDPVKDIQYLPSLTKLRSWIEGKIEGKGLKPITPTQMLQRLPILLAQVKAGNNSEALLNEIRQVAYSLYRANQITKKVYENLMRTI